jgi:TPR repeat protein
MLMSLSIMPKIILGILMVLVMLTMMACAEEVTEEGTVAPESAEEQYELGLGYYNGGFGVPKDFDEAVKWYRKAVDRGIANAQNNLGEMYTYGRAALEDLAKNIMYEVDLCLGPPEDYDEALKWFRKAADQGHAEAQYSIGNMYFFGEGVPEDLAEAFKWYRMAAEQGHVVAQRRLGNIYFYGDGVTRDHAEAAKWWRKAAEQGDADAQDELGDMYYNAQDYVEAVKWYRKAAEQGDERAQYTLGMLWAEGDEGVPEDDAEAEKWYNETQ